MSVICRSLFCCGNPRWRMCRSSTILEVNGQDLSRASHDEAVRAFQLADEPIVVEVLRRTDEEKDTPAKQICNSSIGDTSSPASKGTEEDMLLPSSNSCSSQATSSCSGGMESNTTTSVSNGSSKNGGPPRICSLVSTSVQTEWTTAALGLWRMGQEPDPLGLPVSMYPLDEEEGPVVDNDDCFDEYLTAELDYEEVTLQRTSNHEKLGLTLCYSSGTEEIDTEVYISAVTPDSVAGRDGRLREGDQIVQVNGIDITSKPQAESLFADCKEAVTLLVSRPQFQVSYEEEAELLEDLDCQPDSHVFVQIPEVDEGTIGDLASLPSHQDSGVGHDSMKNEESSEQETNENDTLAVTNNNIRSRSEENTPKTIRQCLHRHSPDNTPKHNHSERDSQRMTRSISHSPLKERDSLGMWSKNCDSLCNQKDKRDSNKRTNKRRETATTPTRLSNSIVNKSGMKKAESQSSIDRELYMLNKKMETIQLECESIVKSSQKQEQSMKPWGESETEHIYETIPENTESDEPIYSIPYESDKAAVLKKNQPEASKLKPKSTETKPTCSVKVNKREDVEKWVQNTSVSTGTVTVIQEIQPTKEESWLKKSTDTTNTTGTSGHESWNRTNSTNNSHSSSTVSGDSNKKPSENKAKSGKTRSSNKGSSSGEEREKDSSSAYNTGESCRSTPALTLELGQATAAEQQNSHIHESTLILSSPPEMEDRSMQVNLDSDTYSVISCESCRRCMRLPPLSPTSGSPLPGSPKKLNACEMSAEKNRNYVSLLPAETMYTNAANLQQTIWLQQQLFRQALVRQHQQHHTARNPQHSPSTDNRKMNNSNLPPPPPPHSPLYVPPFARNTGYFAPNLSQYQFVSSPYGAINTSHNSPNHSHHQGEVQMEWKVKKRPDGTRYITRRPIRNKLLKDRAQKIQEERSGVTTDDDAVSEMKIGRYWTKEERKRHLEIAKERRKRQEAIIRAKSTQNGTTNKDFVNNTIGPCISGGVTGTDTMDSTLGLRGGFIDDKMKKRNINIVELSHKKMARKKNSKEVFDDFTTVQEMLVHGNKIAPGGKIMGLLSVTTV